MELLLRRKVVATRDADELRDVAAEYAAAWRRSRMLGSPATLSAFGAARGSKPTTDALEQLLQGSDAEGELLVRKPRRLRREQAEPNGRTERVVGLTYVHFEFPAPDPVVDVYRARDDQGRAAIGDAMLLGAEGAIAHVASAAQVVAVDRGRTFEPASGFAAAATVVYTPPDRPGDRPTLVVRGVILGVRRHDGAIVGMTGPDVTDAATLEAAGQAGREALADRLRVMGYGRSLTDPLRAQAGERTTQAATEAEAQTVAAEAPTVAVAPPELPSDDPFDRRRRVLGPYADELEARANGLAGFVSEQAEQHGRQWLVARRAELAGTFERLDGLSALKAQSLQRDRERVERALAQTRDPAERRELEARGQALWKQEQELGDDHPRVFMKRNVENAARLVAIERRLEIFDERERAARTARAIARPPQELVDELGAAPDRAAPDRAEWEDLVRRHIAAERPASPVTGAGRAREDLDREREQAQLQAAVRGWRASHGMDGPQKAVGSGVGRGL